MYQFDRKFWPQRQLNHSEFEKGHGEYERESPEGMLSSIANVDRADNSSLYFERNNIDPDLEQQIDDISKSTNPIQVVGSKRSWWEQGLKHKANQNLQTYSNINPSLGQAINNIGNNIKAEVGDLVRDTLRDELGKLLGKSDPIADLNRWEEKEEWKQWEQLVQAERAATQNARLLCFKY